PVDHLPARRVQWRRRSDQPVLHSRGRRSGPDLPVARDRGRLLALDWGPPVGAAAVVTLHFAYGSNMSRALMGARCPGATALGVATLPGWRFVINPDNVGSLAPQAGGLVYGVLWRLTPRDLAAINAYESVDTSLYLRRTLPVRLGASH